MICEPNVEPDASRTWYPDPCTQKMFITRPLTSQTGELGLVHLIHGKNSMLPLECRPWSAVLRPVSVLRPSTMQDTSASLRGGLVKPQRQELNQVVEVLKIQSFSAVEWPGAPLTQQALKLVRMTCHETCGASIALDQKGAAELPSLWRVPPSNNHWVDGTKLTQYFNIFYNILLIYEFYRYICFILRVKLFASDISSRIMASKTPKHRGTMTCAGGCLGFERLLALGSVERIPGDMGGQKWAAQKL